MGVSRRQVLIGAGAAALASRAKAQCAPVPPAAAAAVGYTTLTFGQAATFNATPATPITGANWFPFTFLGASQTESGASQVGSNIVISGAGTDTNNANICTAFYNTVLDTWMGVAFGGGAYIEAVLSFTGTSFGADTPKFWAEDVENLQMQSSIDLPIPWPQASSPNYPDYGHWIETDFAEWNASGSLMYGFGMKDWYGLISSDTSVNTSTIGSPATLPGGTNFAEANKYGFLWVPATSTSQGYAIWYFNDVQIGSPQYWNQYNPALDPPPVLGSSAFSVLDTRHLALILGTESTSNPLTVYSVSVWQSTAANNLVNGAGTESVAGTSVPPSTAINASPVPGIAGSGNIITITSGGQVAVNGVPFSITANVVMLYYTGAGPAGGGASLHAAYQQNSAGQWYGPITTTSSGASPVPSPIPTPPSGTFNVRGGAIYDPNGNLYIAKGVNILNDGQPYPTYANLTYAFPGINHVRIPVYATNPGTSSQVYPAPSTFLSLVEAYTGYTLSGSTWTPGSGFTPVVVEIEDHNQNTGGGYTPLPPNTGTALSIQVAWYTAMATYFAGNPYVWLGGPNEIATPSGTYADISAISDYELTLYNAIRAGSGTCMIQFMAGVGGSNVGTVGVSNAGAGTGFNPADFASMTNIVWEIHTYYSDGDVYTNNGNSYPGIYSTAAGYVLGGPPSSALASASGGNCGWGISGAQSIQSANGIVPVICGEWGSDSGEVSGDDLDQLAAEIKSVQSSLSVGATAWVWGVDAPSEQWSLVNDTVSPLTLNGTGVLVAATIAGGTVQAPLTGTVTAGTWVVNQHFALGSSPSGLGYMNYNYLLPAQYNSNLVYPILFVEHPNDDGMNGSTYPQDGNSFVTGTAFDGYSLNTIYNTVAFRRAFPCIVVAPQCDQTLDLSGENANSNFGGYNDSQNSGWNERAVNGLLQAFITGSIVSGLQVDPSRRYCIGYSLGGIGSLAEVVDNNQWDTPAGGLALWTAGASFSDQLFRPATPNSSVFSRMTTVRFAAFSTSSDNDPTSYDEPAWTSYTGNTSYPSKTNYDTGMSSIQASTSQFYYVNYGSANPAGTFMPTNTDGGDGTTFYTWLFSQVFHA